MIKQAVRQGYEEFRGPSNIIIRIPYEKIADPYLFSSEFCPFLSYAPMEKSGKNLVGKIPQRVFELDTSNVVRW